MNSVLELPIDRIFPLSVDAGRSQQMRDTWTAFCAEMQPQVGEALQGTHSPPEIAYRVGEIVHNHFRTRGLTLASHELRRLVAELLARREPRPKGADELAAMVSFAAPLSPPTDDRGVGPIDRLWADPSVDAVFVHAAKAIYIERDGVIEPATELFRDEAHLRETLGRLARYARSGIAELRLRDGGRGTVVFPPLAPAGPVLALRRADPGAAMFDGLVAAGRVSREQADLLARAARARLNLLLVGPRRSGKTAFLAAVTRSLGEASIVTVARHRAFRWPSPAKVELAAPRDADTASFGRLVEAGAALRLDHLVVDSLRNDDMPAAMTLLADQPRGVVLAVEADAPPVELARSADMVIRLIGRGVSVGIP